MPSKFMSTTIALALIIPLIGVWLMAMPEQAEAHFCSLPPVSEKLGYADRVFMGKVTSVKLAKELGPTVLLSKLAVSTVWKGPLDRTAHVYTYYGCWGAYFEEGREYLVYAYYRDEGEPYLWADLCTAYSMSELQEYYPKELAELGEGQSPPPTIVERFLYGVIGLSLIALVGMLWLSWRTRRVG